MGEFLRLLGEIWGPISTNVIYGNVLGLALGSIRAARWQARAYVSRLADHMESALIKSERRSTDLINAQNRVDILPVLDARDHFVEAVVGLAVMMRDRVESIHSRLGRMHDDPFGRFAIDEYIKKETGKKKITDSDRRSFGVNKGRRPLTREVPQRTRTTL
jgi:hypothetical protein